tara:strand:- start:84 stop:365 length:282 start_codon:yes stop_codon:yes gene_type:complete
MELKIKRKPESKNILIPVASELINHDAIAGITTIKIGLENFKVHYFFTQTKEEYWQTALFLLALGREVEPSEIWNKYKDSDVIYIFVCEPIKD